MIQNKTITRAAFNLQERERLSGSIWEDEQTPHILLATCNRTEVYWGEGAVPESVTRHLFRVASGLESALIGERAIQGQIKQAYTEALLKYKLSPSLNRLFQSAMHVGKRVRTETRIAEGAVSHSQVTVDILREKQIDLKNQVVSLIGVNKLTEDILKFLVSRGAVNIFLANRHLDKAEELAARYHGTAMSLDRKQELLHFTDILICATSAPHAIIRLEDMPDDKSMWIFDLAFPRDVDERIGKLPGVTLYNLEQIEQYARHNLSLRQSEIVKAEQVIGEEMEKLAQWQQKALH
ncbi:MAG: glutamyl-tRNA reductase [Parabacteroides sp.]